ncbi:hypothetical protein MYCTH_2307521 [Thermothelomyces thermophilus ATCC 42464]|uniref:Uncharacterized protein n=1 Tax=Thermothelomyces thermophilus (strain ATCC 42464 / BCRC 31852 / DSM 1799) TaxID=573729 RepID=G2QG04_THET4|nr:uncharacterized protein MYCTH_2307521 [Thermothelomyces thermophilus ATCC 42464]AEO59317.1 hypothetical protein MYCTH_2307521 [Thermothelomyces thermophilus ATCC 42464]
MRRSPAMKAPITTTAHGGRSKPGLPRLTASGGFLRRCLSLSSTVVDKARGCLVVDTVKSS